MSTFLHLKKRFANAPVESGPVLLRYVYYQLQMGKPGWQEEFAKDHLTSYPAQVLYGGPTTAEALNTPMGRAFQNSMRLWFANQGYTSHLMLIPIAPERYGHRWPHRNFRWWYKTEYAPRATYKKQALWYGGKDVRFRWVLT